MTLLWLRRIEVHVADLVISKPKIAVSMKREVSSTPVSGHVSIYNLSVDRERSINRVGAPLSIVAGYEAAPALIFEGTIQRLERERKGLTRETKLILGGAVVAVEKVGGEVFALSYAEPVPVRTIASDIVARMGLTLGPLDAIPANEQRPWAYTGSGAAQLNILERGSQWRWYEDDGTIKFNQPRQAQSDADRVEVSPETGLLESPSITEDGARCRTLLNPRFKLGGIVDLKSEALTGTYKIIALTHEGDNWTGRFLSELELRPV